MCGCGWCTWTPFCSPSNNCPMYISDAFPMHHQARRPAVPMALLWLASQHGVDSKRQLKSGAPPSPADCSSKGFAVVCSRELSAYTANSMAAYTTAQIQSKHDSGWSQIKGSFETCLKFISQVYTRSTAVLPSVLTRTANLLVAGLLAQSGRG